MAASTKTAEATPKRVTTSVSLLLDVVQKLRVICAERQVSAYEALDPLIRPWIDREYKKVLADINRRADLGGES